MQDFTLALVAHDSPLGCKAQNLDATERWVRLAARRGGELISLPELNLTGHGGHASMVAEAEPVPGPSVRRLEKLAAELGVFISAGIAEADGGAFYNTSFLVGPQGYVGKQRKVHLSSDEYFFFRGGTEIRVLDLPFARVGIVICYDNVSPEPMRCCAVQGAEVILSPHAARFGAWPRRAAARRAAVKKHLAGWARTHQCRALENGVYVGLCNTAGQSARGIADVQANHCGGCMVVDPLGEIVAATRPADVREELLTCRLKAKVLHDKRLLPCFNLRTRRVDAFRSLAAPTA